MFRSRVRLITAEGRHVACLRPLQAIELLQAGEATTVAGKVPMAVIREAVDRGPAVRNLLPSESTRVCPWCRQIHDAAEFVYGRCGRCRIEVSRRLAYCSQDLRRVRMAHIEGQHTQAEWESLCDAAGRRCLCCGIRTVLTRDHIIPVALGGTNDIGNIQPLCRACNSAKGTKTTDYRK